MMRLRRNRYIKQAAAMMVRLRTGVMVKNNVDKEASRSKR